MPVPTVTVFSVTEKEAPEARSDASLYSFQHRPRNIILNITAQRRKLVVISLKGRKSCVLLQVPGRGGVVRTRAHMNHRYRLDPGVGNLVMRKLEPAQASCLTPLLLRRCQDAPLLLLAFGPASVVANIHLFSRREDEAFRSRQEAPLRPHERTPAPRPRPYILCTEPRDTQRTK